MPGEIAAAAGQLIAHTGQGIVNQIFAKRNIRNQLKANSQLAKYTNSMNVENWKMQNQYNTPAAQMQRFKEAGLNPNLMYKQGNEGNAGSLPNYQQPVTDVTMKNPFDLPQMAGSTIGSYLDVKLKNAQTDNVKQQTQNAVTKNAQDILQLQYEKQYGSVARDFANKIAEQKWAETSAGAKIAGLKATQTEMLLPYQNVALKAEYDVKSRAMERYNLDIALLNQKKELNKAQIELMDSQVQLNKMGIPGKVWDNMLKGQEYNQKAKLFPTQLGTAEKQLKWLPWNNAAKIGGAAVGAGIGTYGALKGGKKVNTGTKPLGYTIYR